LARLAGLSLSSSILEELIKSYPAFEAMVRRLPRARPRFDDPAHHLVPPQGTTLRRSLDLTANE